MHILFDADWTFLNSNYLDAAQMWVDASVLQDFFVNAFPPTTTGSANLKEIIVPYLHKMWRNGTVDSFLKK